MTSTLAPLLRQIESEVERKLLTNIQRKRMRIRFNLDDYYQSDPTLMATSIKNLVQGGILTPNEARERLGKKPLAGYDKLIVVGGKEIAKEGSTGGPSKPSGPSEPSKPSGPSKPSRLSRPGEHGCGHEDVII